MKINMEWLSYLLFLIVGYVLRLLGEFRKDKKAGDEPAFKMPTINPVEIHKQKEEKREQEQRDRETAIMLENIDNYNGTSLGQKDVK